MFTVEDLIFISGILDDFIENEDSDHIIRKAINLKEKIINRLVEVNLTP
jgi:hypothetical protein